MADIDAVNARLAGTGWAVALTDDPNIDRVGQDGTTEINPTNPGVIVAARGDAVHLFSPSHTDDELIAALKELN